MLPGPPTKVATVRLDRWLWAARLFKTRNLAAGAARGHRVIVNDEVAKPSKSLRVGDTVTIKHRAIRVTVQVKALDTRRRPAGEAMNLYTETEASISAREEWKVQRAATQTGHPARRPNKKERRAIIRFTRSS